MTVNEKEVKEISEMKNFVTKESGEILHKWRMLAFKDEELLSVINNIDSVYDGNNLTLTEKRNEFSNTLQVFIRSRQKLTNICHNVLLTEQVNRNKG